MIDIQKAAVYCGTYKKYNEGSLEGAWIHLNDYQTWRDFNAKCCEIHKDETEPEFMYQDAQYLPTEFFTEHWVYSEIFQVLSEIRNWSEDKLEALDDWCKETAAIPDMYDIETFEGLYESTEHLIKKTNTDKDLQEYKKLADEYSAKQTIDVIKIAEGKYYVFEKSLTELKKRFCWGYSFFGQGMLQEEAHKIYSNFGEKEFKEENLKRFDKAVKTAADIDCNINYYTHPGQLCLGLNYRSDKTAEFYIKSKSFLDEDSCNDLLLDTEASEMFKKVYLNKVAELRAKFEKKIDNYLKKYGVSKIKKWTYCSDD